MKKITKIMTLLLLALSIFSCKQQPEEKNEATQLILTEQEIAGLNQSIDMTSTSNPEIPNGKYKIQIVILEKNNNYSSRETITSKFKYEGEVNTATIFSCIQYDLVTAYNEESKQAYAQNNTGVNITWNGLNGSSTKVYTGNDLQWGRLLFIYPYACSPLQTNKAKTKFYGYGMLDEKFFQMCLIKQ